MVKTSFLFCIAPVISIQRRYLRYPVDTGAMSQTACVANHQLKSSPSFGNSDCLDFEYVYQKGPRYCWHVT